MGEARFTPGPWYWRDDINGGEYNLAPGVLLTDATDGTPWGDEIDRANANLIAAAPSLYEALEGLVGYIAETAHHNRPEAATARAALRLARGEEDA